MTSINYFVEMQTTYSTYPNARTSSNVAMVPVMPSTSTVMGSVTAMTAKMKNSVFDVGDILTTVKKLEEECCHILWAAIILINRVSVIISL